MMTAHVAWKSHKTVGLSLSDDKDEYTITIHIPHYLSSVWNIHSIFFGCVNHSFCYSNFAILDVLQEKRDHLAFFRFYSSVLLEKKCWWYMYVYVTIALIMNTVCMYCCTYCESLFIRVCAEHLKCRLNVNEEVKLKTPIAQVHFRQFSVVKASRCLSSKKFWRTSIITDQHIYFHMIFIWII